MATVAAVLDVLFSTHTPQCQLLVSSSEDLVGCENKPQEGLGFRV